MSTFEEISELLGNPVAEWLKKNYQGRRVWVPCRITESHPLSNLGEAASQLAYYYGGTRIGVPSDRGSRYLERDQKIFQAWKEGTRAADLAREYKMSERNVYKVIDRVRDLESQNNAK